MPRLIRQPEGSGLCGHACVAMAAGVSLDRACEVIGHRKFGTHTYEVIRALNALGIDCAKRMRPVSRVRPVLPERALLSIRQDRDKALSVDRRLYHWMLTWDGKIFDPGGKWPNYEGWRITSALEIHRG